MAGRIGAAASVENFDVSDLPCQIAAQVPRGAGARRLPSRRLDGAEGAAAGRRFHRLRDGGGDAGACATPTGRPRPTRKQIETGVLIGSGIGGLEGIAETAIAAARERPAPRLAVLHSRPPDQSGQRAGVDPAQAQRTEPLGRHRLLDRRARHRRRGAADRARRRRRDGRRRRRIGVNRLGARRFRRLQGAVDRLQRPAEAGLAPLRPRPRRLRDGRGRRLRRAGGATITPRRAARRFTPRSSATACPATPITSPRPRRTATAPFARCPRR